MRSVLIVSKRGDQLSHAFGSARCDFTVAGDAGRASQLAAVIAFDVVLIDTASEPIDPVAVSRTLRQAAGPRVLRIVALGNLDHPPRGCDGVLPDGLSPDDIVANLMGRRSQQFEVPSVG